jgi:hypothetical protein
MNNIEIKGVTKKIRMHTVVVSTLGVPLTLIGSNTDVVAKTMNRM